jgi:DNA-binding CsgD family transcriptional regulator
MLDAMADYLRTLPFDQRISPALHNTIEPERLSVITMRTLRQEAEQPPEPGTKAAIYHSIYEGVVTPPADPDPSLELSPTQDSILNLSALGRNTAQTARMLRLPRSLVRDEEAMLADRFGALTPGSVIVAAFRQRFWLPKKELCDPNLPELVVPRIDYLAERAAKIALEQKDRTALQLLADGETHSGIDAQLNDATNHFRNVRMPMLRWRLGARSVPHLVRIAAEAGLITPQAAAERQPRPQEVAALELLTLGYSRPEIAGIMQINETGVVSHLARAIGTLDAKNQCNAVSAAQALGLWAQATEPPA